MNYAVSLSGPARKMLARLPSETYQRVLEEISHLGQNPRLPGCEKMAGRRAWKIRVGNYRIIYEIDDRERVYAF